jgi:hypothetical protein
MTTASDAIVRAYLEALQAARRTPAAVSHSAAWPLYWRPTYSGGSPEALPSVVAGRVEQPGDCSGTAPATSGVLVAAANRDDLSARMRTSGTRGAGQHSRG